MGATKLSRFDDDAAQAHYREAYDRTLAAGGVDVTRHDVATEFGTTHVLEAGRADRPPLVLLHTMSFSSTVWVRNLAALSADHRVLAVDTVGDLGLSRSERTVTGRSDWVRWLEQALEPFGLPAAAMAGNSYGGWLATAFAVDRPDRVTRLVLISPPVLFAPLRPAFFARVIRAPFIRRPAGAERFARWFFHAGTFEDEVARLWLEQFKVGMPTFTISRAFPRPKPLAEAELRGLSVPVLLVEGEDEPIHDPRKAIGRAHERLPGVKSELLPGTKHVAPLEQPDRLNDLMCKFLAD
jgi:pimeloyl-ACP methyl ester carboxylesterase